MYLECEFDMIFLFKKELSYEEIIGLSENYKNYLETKGYILYTKIQWDDIFIKV
jgi:hypothetical protein